MREDPELDLAPVRGDKRVPGRGDEGGRILFPSGVRMGVRYKSGSVEIKRPDALTVC